MFANVVKKITLVLGLVALGVSASFLKHYFTDSDELVVYSNNIKATVLERPIPVRDMKLESVQGEFTEKNLRNKWSFLFFGYTHCPDVCPTTLTLLQHVNTNLQSKGKDIQTIFVTLDPSRDSVKHMGEYVSFFNKEFIGLSGTQQKVDAFARSLGILYEKGKPAKDGSYDVDHTASIFLVNPQAEVKALFSTQFATVENIVAETIRLTEN